MVFVVLCPGTPGGSTGSGSGIQFYLMLSPYLCFIFFLYINFIDFICSRRWYIDVSGVFHANQTSI